MPSQARVATLLVASVAVVINLLGVSAQSTEELQESKGLSEEQLDGSLEGLARSARAKGNGFEFLGRNGRSPHTSHVVNQRSSFDMLARNGKRSGFNMLARNGKRSSFDILARNGKRAAGFDLLARNGKRSSFDVLARNGKRAAGFDLLARNGKRATGFDMLARNGKRATGFDMLARNGKRSDFDFLGRAGKRSSFDVLTRNGKKRAAPENLKRGEFDFFVGRNGKRSSSASTFLGRDSRADFDFLGRNGKRSAVPANAPTYSGDSDEEPVEDGIVRFVDDRDDGAPARTIEDLINEAQVLEEVEIGLRNAQ